MSLVLLVDLKSFYIKLRHMLTVKKKCITRKSLSIGIVKPHTSLGQFLLPVQLRWTINSITGTALNSWLHPKVCMFNARHVDSKAAVFTE